MSAVGARFAKLLDLARAPTSEKRRELLREATDLFFETADIRTSRETGLFDDVLRTVAREMQEQVLVELATRFADSADAPVQLMHDLAAHTFTVAEPVLKRSPVLKEDALVKLVNEQSQDHIRAIAQRDTVSPRVSEAIVTVGNDAALETLLQNAGAVIERRTMEKVVDRARDNARLHSGVVGRTDIPLDLLNEMYFVVEKKLRAAIMERNATVDPAELDEALARARTRMQQRSQTAMTEDLRAAARLIEQKKRSGELKPALLVGLYRDKQYAAFTLGLAEIVGLDYDTTNTIIARKDMEALAMICRASNIERPLFVTIAVLCCGGTDAMTQAEAYGRLYMAVPVEAAQRAMRFYKVRKNAGVTPAAA
jgi:uncharacterized protein (DUF2336 family)